MYFINLSAAHIHAGNALRYAADKLVSDRLCGAGALFWMWVSALLAMVLKYAEILLAVSHRRTAPDGTHTGSAVCYIRDRFPSRAGTALAAVFGGLTVLDALSMGCVIQVNAVSSALHGTLGLPARKESKQRS